MKKVTEALVLTSQTVAEKDVLLFLLSPRWGRFSALAKGGKKSKKRFVNALEPFSYLRVHVRGGRFGLAPFLDQADLLEPFENLRSSPIKFVEASYLTELTEIFFRPGTGKEIFPYLLKAFYFLDRGSVSWALLRPYFELHLLAQSGFLHRFGECIGCGRKPDSLAYFSFEDGGICCEACAKENQIPFSLKTWAFLGHLQSLAPEKLSRLRPNAEILKQAQMIIEKFLLRVADREINSLRILKEVLKNTDQTGEREEN